MLARGDRGARRDLPLGEIRAVVGEVPAADILGDRAGVLQLDPVLPLAAEIGEPDSLSARNSLITTAIASRDSKRSKLNPERRRVTDR